MTTPLETVSVTPVPISAMGEAAPPVAETGGESQTASSAPPSAPVLAPLPAYETPADPSDPPGPNAKAIAHWIHQHPTAPKKGLGLWGYHIVRSAIACIPYGLSMAAVSAGFAAAANKGATLAETGSNGAVRSLGRNLKGFMSYGPARMSAMIGASFTLYRATSKLGKWMTEYLFNPKDSEQRTAEKVDDLPQEAWRKVKEIAPAEASSTPVAAIVLGFIVSAFAKPEAQALKTTINGAERSFDWTRAAFKALPDWSSKLKAMGHAIVNPKAKFLPQSVINTFGYALFFEMSDRLYKDKQIQRGVWPGEPHSIKALKAAPEEYEQGIKAQHNQGVKKYEDSAAEARADKNHYPFFTAEPSIGRFVFRRVLPTAAAITLYTGVKMRWASMLGNDLAYANGVTWRAFGKKSLTEGVATIPFFLIPLAAESWEKTYDHFFAAREKQAQAKEQAREQRVMGAMPQALTPEQQQHYEALLARVNAKEKGADAAVLPMR